MEDRHLPTPTTTLLVDIRGAEIVDEEEEAPETSDIYLPKHTEFISHIAVDIGGSLAKVVYFTQAPQQSRPHRSPGHSPPSSVLNGLPPPNGNGYCDRSSTSSNSSESGPSTTPGTRTPRSNAIPNGILTPKLVRLSSSDCTDLASKEDLEPSNVVSSIRKKLADTTRARAPSATTIPGGRLNFTKFESGAIETECIPFIAQLISTSAQVNGVPLESMRKAVKIMATGGGAHMYYELLSEQLGVEVRREEEMDCLITGLGFITEIPEEVFWFSDELVQKISHASPTAGSSIESMTLPGPGRMSNSGTLPPPPTTVPATDLPRPSPNPPEYSLLFDANPTAQFPCLLVNIGSGVSMIKVDDHGYHERISGTSIGGGTLWGLLSLLTGAESFDEMLDLSMKGDNAGVDMLVGDIYGQDYGKIGLKSSTIASSFGKVFRKGREKREFKPEDISKSLLYAVSNNIGQIAFLNAEKYGLDRIYFSGCFIRGHAATVSTLSYAIRFWSKGTKRAFFLRHEGYLGAIGAWLKNVGEEGEGV